MANDDVHSSDVESALQETPGAEEQVIPDGSLFPLNSRRLRSVHVRLLAQTLGLPTANISIEEIRQLIDGALLEREKEPRNCQVVVQEHNETVSCMRLFLLDGTGVFQQSEPHYTPLPGGQVEPDLSELQLLKSQLQEMSERLQEAEEKRQLLQSRLQETSERLQAAEKKGHEAQAMLRREETSQRLWAQSCRRLEELDTALANQEDQLAALRIHPTQPPELFRELGTHRTHPQVAFETPIAPPLSPSLSVSSISLPQITPRFLNIPPLSRQGSPEP